MLLAYILVCEFCCSRCLTFFFHLVCLMDLTLSLVACWDYGWCLNVNTFGSLGTTTWSRAWIIEALLWINQRDGCSVDALALVVVMVDGIMWLSGRDASCLSSHSRTREPSHEEEEEEDGRFSVYQSLCISIKERFPCHACLCESVNGCVCPSSSSPHLPVCARVAEERKRWDVVIVTVSRYSGGEWPSGEMWCLCRVS